MPCCASKLRFSNRARSRSSSPSVRLNGAIGGPTLALAHCRQVHSSFPFLGLVRSLSELVQAGHLQSSRE